MGQFFGIRNLFTTGKTQTGAPELRVQEEGYFFRMSWKIGWTLCEMNKKVS